MSLLSMSISGAVMILVVALLRALTLHRLPKRVFWILWCIVLARLLIPYSLPSVFSVYSLAGRLAPAAETGEALFNASGTPALLTQGAAAMPSAGAYTAPASLPAVSPFFIAWLAGALALAGYFTAAYIKCRRMFRESLPVENAWASQWLASHPPRRPVALRQSGRIPAPLTYGILRPVILMPKSTDWDDPESLRYVLAHESAHICRFDALAKLALNAALCLHWFNPAVWGMYLLANRDIELCCDEAVIRLFGDGAKAAYVKALLGMEKTKSGLTPLCSHFNKNPLEERIVAIMKIKKISLAALCAAAVLVAGVTTAFATTAAEPSTEEQDRAQNAAAVIEQQEMMSYTDPRDGKTYYSVDGGKTFEALTEAEFEARYPSPDVVWWTYDEYAAWLEEEKEALQGMIGETGWTSGRGEFVWTQEIVDEAIALYESILAEIGRGILVSKTVDGSEDTMLAMGTADWYANNTPAPVSSLAYDEYEPFGVTINADENALYYNGEKIRYLEDSVSVGEGGVASRQNYYSQDGTISLRIVRQTETNPDGSLNPFGPIVRIEPLTEEEAQRLIRENILRPAQNAAVATGNDACEGTPLPDMFEKYQAYGIVYRETETINGIERNLYYNGTLVDTLADQSPDGSVFTFGSTQPGGICVQAVYDENGRLAGVEAIPAGD